ncbi:hypothetical protein GCM10011338_40790 [Alteromonas lipolytica]|nr:hypothetical protein GCM10011338_40790 [Alteromonas lipolytica]
MMVGDMKIFKGTRRIVMGKRIGKVQIEKRTEGRYGLVQIRIRRTYYAVL